MARSYSGLVPTGKFVPGEFEARAPIALEAQRNAIAQAQAQAEARAQMAQMTLDRERLAQQGRQFSETMGLDRERFGLEGQKFGREGEQWERTFERGGEFEQTRATEEARAQALRELTGRREYELGAGGLAETKRAAGAREGVEERRFGEESKESKQRRAQIKQQMEATRRAWIEEGNPIKKAERLREMERLEIATAQLNYDTAKTEEGRRAAAFELDQKLKDFQTREAEMNIELGSRELERLKEGGADAATVGSVVASADTNLGSRDLIDFGSVEVSQENLDAFERDIELEFVRQPAVSPKVVADLILQSGALRSTVEETIGALAWDRDAKRADLLRRLEGLVYSVMWSRTPYDQ